MSSIANRLNALRPPGKLPSTQPSATRPSHKPPPIPNKPEALSTNRTPPGSPTPHSQDIASLNDRSSSAPPEIPIAGGDPKDTMGLGLGDRAEYGLGQAGQNGWTKAPPRRTPSTFNAAFPSVDALDNMAWVTNTARSDMRRSGVPSGLPGPPSSSNDGSGRPGSTSSQASSQARPLEVDAGELDREKAQRAATMAKLDGSPPTRRSTGLPPGASHAPEVRMSAPTPGSGVRGPLPLAPPTAIAKGKFPMPMSDNLAPGALWQYFQQPVAQDGTGPRVLLLDVRSRDEFERGHVKGEVVCLEPAAIRPG